MRRPSHAAGGLLTAVHQAVELGFGTGVIGQSAAGLAPAIAASVAFDAGWVAAARRGRADRTLGFLAGVAVGVPVIHFTLWPWKLRKGLPVLTEAEGLPPRLMPLYNVVLYAWALAGLVAVATDTPRRARPWALAGAASVIGIRPAARAHFDWMAVEARRNPRWWNRAWA